MKAKSSGKPEPLVTVCRELLARFVAICPDVDGNTDPHDKRLIRRVEKALTKTEKK
jgi:hypothetical protein